MRLTLVTLSIVVVGLSGCQSARLRQRTINQADTLPELQFQQVLNNLAQFAVNPSTLPWHVTLKEGTSQITDSLSGGAAVDLGPPAETLPQVFGSRTVVAQWGMAPVVDASELRLLRIAYRRAFGVPDMPSPDFLEELGHELKEQIANNTDLQQETTLFYTYQAAARTDPAALEAHTVTTNDDRFCTPVSLAKDRSPLARNTCRKLQTIQRDLLTIQPGWFHVGRKRDVPKNACYVGHSGDTYAWVCPEGREQLTEFTLMVLKFSALIKETQTLINPGSVKFSPGDRNG
jgi:hypothetical protein